MSFFANVALILSIAGGVNAAYATSFYERPFPETVEEAPVIVRGKTGNHYADWSTDSDGGKRIYTFYELQIDEVIKGSINGANLRMRELGGQKDGLGMQVAGTSKFTTGEDVVVFLGEKNPDGSHDVFGMMMGKYNLKKNDNGDEVITGPGIPSGQGHGGVVHPGEEPGVEIEGQDGTQPHAQWTLEHLRKLVKEQGAKPAPAETSVSSTGSSNASTERNGADSQPKKSDQAAPQLQTSTPVGDVSASPDQSSFMSLILPIAVALLGLGGVFALLRLRRK